MFACALTLNVHEGDLGLVGQLQHAHRGCTWKMRSLHGVFQVMIEQSIAASKNTLMVVRHTVLIVATDKGGLENPSGPSLLRIPGQAIFPCPSKKECVFYG